MENTSKKKFKKTAKQAWIKMPLVNKGWNILFNKSKPSVNEIELGRSL